MKQLTLEGFDVPYTCKKCNRHFETMSQIKKHQRNAHKPRQEKTIQYNLVLENFKMVSVREVLEIEM